MEKINIRGEFKLKVFDKGHLVEEFIEQNLITNTGFALVQALLSSASDDMHISRIAFGELLSGEPVAPSPGQSAVINRIDVTTGVDYKSFDSVTFPTVRSVSFNWQLTGVEANGHDISYFGLLNQGDQLFAAKSRQPITKTADIVLEGTWILHY